MTSSLLSKKGCEIVRKAVHKDESAAREEYLFAPPTALSRRLLTLLDNNTDFPILYLYLNIATITVPAACLLFIKFPASHLAGLVYFMITYVLFLQRFMLALHYSEHRRLFRQGYSALNYIAPLLFSPFFGVPSGMYRLHHCVMHHVGNNQGGVDASSTERWHRGNPLHFLLYWARHAVFGLIEVPIHAALYKRWDLFIGCIATESLYICMCWKLYAIAPIATTWALLVPFGVSSFALMFGNWSQHIFINPEAPRSNHGLAYNCAGCPDNQRSFNDGYHIVHHNNSKMHWSLMPGQLLASLEEHAKNDALVFLDIGFFEIGAAVFSRQWGFLARHLARYSRRFADMSEEEVVCMLKHRLEPIRNA